MSPYGMKSPKPNFTSRCVGRHGRKSSLAATYDDGRMIFAAIPTSSATKRALRRINKRAARREGLRACAGE